MCCSEFHTLCQDKKIFGGMFGKIRLVEETVPEKTEGEDTEESTGSQKTDSDKAEGTVPMEVEKTEAQKRRYKSLIRDLRG